MNTISVRIATANDTKTIAALSRETFYNAFAPANTKKDMEKFMNEIFTEEKLIAEFDVPDNIFLLAYNHNEIAGYTKLRDISIPETALPSENIIEIARIYTATQAIGKGIGTILMNECINIAQTKNRDYLWLGVWEKNIKAINFYERFGFTKFGEHPFILGNDIQTDWLMALKLT